MSLIRNTTNAFAKRSNIMNNHILFLFVNYFFLKFVNPDDDFLLCECETAYHEDCVLDDSINCLYCGKQLKDEIYFS